MADPVKLSLADHALIHLVAYLSIEWPQHPTWLSLQHELGNMLVHANREIPTIAEFADVAQRLAFAQLGSAELTLARQQGDSLTRQFHARRAVTAIDQLRAPKQEVANV